MRRISRRRRISKRRRSRRRALRRKVSAPPEVELESSEASKRWFALMFVVMFCFQFKAGS